MSVSKGRVALLDPLKSIGHENLPYQSTPAFGQYTASVFMHFFCQPVWYITSSNTKTGSISNLLSKQHWFQNGYYVRLGKHDEKPKEGDIIYRVIALNHIPTKLRLRPACAYDKDLAIVEFLVRDMDKVKSIEEKLVTEVTSVSWKYSTSAFSFSIGLNKKTYLVEDIPGEKLTIEDLQPEVKTTESRGGLLTFWGIRKAEESSAALLLDSIFSKQSITNKLNTPKIILDLALPGDTATANTGRHHIVVQGPSLLSETERVPSNARKDSWTTNSTLIKAYPVASYTTSAREGDTSYRYVTETENILLVDIMGLDFTLSAKLTRSVVEKSPILKKIFDNYSISVINAQKRAKDFSNIKTIYTPIATADKSSDLNQWLLAICSPWENPLRITYPYDIPKRRMTADVGTITWHAASIDGIEVVKPTKLSNFYNHLKGGIVFSLYEIMTWYNSTEPGVLVTPALPKKTAPSSTKPKKKVVAPRIVTPSKPVAITDEKLLYTERSNFLTIQEIYDTSKRPPSTSSDFITGAIKISNRLDDTIFSWKFEDIRLYKRTAVGYSPHFGAFYALYRGPVPFSFTRGAILPKENTKIVLGKENNRPQVFLLPTKGKIIFSMITRSKEGVETSTMTTREDFILKRNVSGVKRGAYILYFKKSISSTGVVLPEEYKFLIQPSENEADLGGDVIPVNVIAIVK